MLTSRRRWHLCWRVSVHECHLVHCAHPKTGTATAVSGYLRGGSCGNCGFLLPSDRSPSVSRLHDGSQCCLATLSLWILLCSPRVEMTSVCVLLEDEDSLGVDQHGRCCFCPVPVPLLPMPKSCNLSITTGQKTNKQKAAKFQKPPVSWSTGTGVRIRASTLEYQVELKSETITKILLLQAFSSMVECYTTHGV